MAKLHHHKWVFIVLLTFVSHLSCRDNPTTPEQTPTSLQILSETQVVFPGLEIPLSAVATLSDGSTRDVTSEAVWSTEPGVAGQINDNGEFSGVIGQTGVETVRAQFQGQEAMLTIEVISRAEVFSIIPVVTFLKAGESVQFEAIAQFENGSLEFVTDKVTWSVSPGLAGEIDENGRFLALSEAIGEETVSAQFQDRSDQSTVNIGSDLRTKFNMAEIASSTFVMGDNTGPGPEHEVTVDGFLIGKNEITNAEYAEFLTVALERGEIAEVSGVIFGVRGRFANLPYMTLQGTPNFPDEYIEFGEFDRYRAKPGFEEYPVVRLSWYGAAAFCDFYGLRLPTEAEWELASRGGQQFEYGTVDGTISHDLANFLGTGGTDTFEGLAPVGTFPANPFGLHDLCGNAAEYVFDIFDFQFYGVSPSHNPIGPGPAKPLGRLPAAGRPLCRDGGPRVVWRGGHWLSGTSSCRSAFRGSACDLPDFAETVMVGFRVAKSLSE